MADNSGFDVSTFMVRFGLVSRMLTDHKRYGGIQGTDWACDIQGTDAVNGA